ncbi:hypothetical protein L596_023348 [Steinernema carpocapsae]|uniref:receptor protein-tyrosine kinase n=1 Tax=Steinernema carpocapsae TaxID=34508 RepID=A0A4U5MDK9_STECR|nr:hypothetical protein L596_023348 [Steinernema carpocapsae]
MQQVPEQWVIKSSQVKLAKDKQKPIGTGNFADVYLGTHQNRKNRNVIVAVKMSKATVLRKAQSVTNSTTTTTTTSTVTGDEISKEDALNEMHNEAKIMSLLHHPHVIEFYGISMEKTAMIIMEYCPGQSLEAHLVAMKENISNGERVMYLIEICSGMKYLESKNIVHRDLASRNVLISSAGQLKIADFGLSRAPSVDSGNQATSLIQIPVRWMAPESLRKDGPFNSKSDVWSYGVVGYEIYNYGVKPWPEMPAKWIATRIRQLKMVKPPNRTPRPVREVVVACWKQNPADRPSFAQISGRLAYIQNIRFMAPSPEKYSLNKIKGVSRIDALEDEPPDSLFIELDYTGSKDKEHDNKSKIQQKRNQQNQIEDRKAKEMNVQSIRDFVPPSNAPPSICGKVDVGREVHMKSKKKCSAEDLGEDDPVAAHGAVTRKDSKEEPATKETVEEMEPTDRI